jgi:hypothetical protein
MDAQDNQDIQGLDSDMTDDVVLVSCETEEPERISINKDVAKQSKLVAATLEMDPHTEEITLAYVSRDLLPHIVDYMNHHHNNPAGPISQPLKGPNLVDSGATEWDAKFIELPGVEPPREGEHADTFPRFRESSAIRMFVASNYMDITGLTELCGAKLGSLIINDHVNVRLASVGLPPQPEEEVDDESEPEEEEEEEEEEDEEEDDDEEEKVADEDVAMTADA